MTRPADLALFGHLVRKPDAELDLERAALMIAEAEYPGLDLAACVHKLDELARIVRKRLDADGLYGSDTADNEAIRSVLDCVYGELRFRGNVRDYYDPRNSFLNDVIERRTGIPITMAIVLIGICRRVGIDAQGVSFPGHFLVRVPGWGRTLQFVDPFDGRLLGQSHLKALYEQATGDPGEIDPRFLEPAGRRQILVRMLNNLRAIHEVRGDHCRLKQMLSRMAIISPCPDTSSRLEMLLQNQPLQPRISLN